MSVTVTKADGVTVFTLNSDPQSLWPPLCQVLKGLCYSPVCCSVSQRLRSVQTSQPVLGALQIMVGLLNIGFGAILLNCPGTWWQVYYLMFPFWLGGLFILFGIMSILSEKCPSPCMVFVNVILNLAGVAFAITAIVLYSINMGNIDLWWMCHRDNYEYWRSTSPPVDNAMMRKCLEGEALLLLLLRSINGVLIVLAALELCLVISSAVLGIKALKTSEKGEKRSIDDPELYKPLLEEVTCNPAA